MSSNSNDLVSGGSHDEDSCDLEWEGIYHENFPQEWAVNHEPGTGPEECNNCAYFGSIGDVFIGYCANCAAYVYEGSRGRGFVGDGIECTDDDAMQYTSAFDTYLQGIVFEPENLEPYDNTETNVMDCHFEGGYNDF
jgi:hypothetical protein